MSSLVGQVLPKFIRYETLAPDTDSFIAGYTARQRTAYPMVIRFPEQALIFPLKHKVPLFILYEVAWPNAKGEIRFYDDVYNKVKN